MGIFFNKAWKKLHQLGWIGSYIIVCFLIWLGLYIAYRINPEFFFIEGYDNTYHNLFAIGAIGILFAGAFLVFVFAVFMMLGRAVVGFFENYLIKGKYNG